jgi:Flp pilus assembly pilin Flp
MKDSLLKLYVKAAIWREDHGQDLIEYALTAGLIALGCVLAMNNLATTIGTALAAVGTKLTNATS